MPRPLIFISHIHEDAAVATELQRWISDALLDGVLFFNTAQQPSLQPGDPWRDIIIAKLRECTLLLTITSSQSVRRPWINFESGGAWLAGAAVIPCCCR